ncbi:phosphotransferase family protein [Natronoglycomyces albus]|uniref:Aminoglycoside phosphotransferase family protein n=1 Tax=Natronoglycomyces albus TaxID=2811108 RepID=A0A895XM58_9ACTN|nr:aminoglycoside phosphotransferase family protein [Natronoglycomyces albus]QSB04623.1 aminoglycoside phosphotransferase family protein [Natronoglycomyces albus]
MALNSEHIEESLAELSAQIGRPLRVVHSLAGGQHARTFLVSDGVDEYVARVFPPEDTAATHEVGILERLEPLGDAVPHLVAVAGAASPVVLTTRVPGSTPHPQLPPEAMAAPLARMLARIHALDGSGLRLAPARVPPGDSPIAQAAQAEWDRLDTSERVLTHYDLWIGNTLWQARKLTGVVDWSGARHAPRAVDLAWFRQDLVLLGSVAAAESFRAEYERICGPVKDLELWDRQAAAQADPAVEAWAANYVGIGRPQITARLLRQRLNAWSARLLRAI